MLLFDVLMPPPLCSWLWAFKVPVMSLVDPRVVAEEDETGGKDPTRNCGHTCVLN